MKASFLDCAAIAGMMMTFSIPALAATTSIPEDFRVTPEPGSTVESITKIVVTNTEGDQIMAYGGSLIINGESYSYRSNSDWGEVTFILTEPITEDGEYDITIPAGKIVYEDDWSAVDAFQFSLIVKSNSGSGDNKDDNNDNPTSGKTSIPEGYSVTPAPGSTVTSITDIEVTNTDGDDIMGLTNVISINGTSTSVIASSNANKVTFKLNEPITENGNYEIRIPAGKIVDSDFDAVDAFLFTVTVKNGETSGNETVIPKNFTMSPTPGTEVDAISDINITYNDDYSELSLSKKVILVNGEETAINGFGDWGELTITLLKKITAAGTYNIVIPAGTFTIDGLDDNEEFSFSYTVSGKEDNGSGDDGDDDNNNEPSGELAGIPNGFTVTPAADDTVESISTITIVDDYLGDLYVNEGSKLYIDGTSVDYTAVVEGEYADTLILTLATPIIANGEHSIQLPAGFFNYGVTRPCSEFGWKVTVSNETGVSLINADNTDITIYSIDGVKVTNPEPGRVYIIRQGNKAYKQVM